MLRIDVPLVALHVVHVEQDLAGGAVDRAADHVGLRREAAGTGPACRPSGSSTITRLAFASTSAPARSVSIDVRRLHVDRQPPIEVARHDRHPLGVAALGDVDRRRARLDEVAGVLRLAAGEVGAVVAAGLDHEHAHRDAELGHQVAHLLLQLRGPAHHPVVLERREALVGHEAQLIERVLPRRVREHAEVRRVLQLERVLLAPRRTRGGGRPAGQRRARRGRRLAGERGLRGTDGERARRRFEEASSVHGAPIIGQARVDCKPATDDDRARSILELYRRRRRRGPPAGDVVLRDQRRGLRVLVADAIADGPHRTSVRHGAGCRGADARDRARSTQRTRADVRLERLQQLPDPSRLGVGREWLQVAGAAASAHRGADEDVARRVRGEAAIDATDRAALSGTNSHATRIAGDVTIGGSAARWARVRGTPRRRACAPAESRGCRRGRTAPAARRVSEASSNGYGAGRSGGSSGALRRRRRAARARAPAPHRAGRRRRGARKPRCRPASRCVVSHVPASVLRLKPARLHRSEALAQRAARRVEIDQRHALLDRQRRASPPRPTAPASRPAWRSRSSALPERAADQRRDQDRRGADRAHLVDVARHVGGERRRRDRSRAPAPCRADRCARTGSGSSRPSRASAVAQWPSSRKLFELRPFCAVLVTRDAGATSCRKPRPQPEPSVTVESPTSTMCGGRGAAGGGACGERADAMTAAVAQDDGDRGLHRVAQMRRIQPRCDRSIARAPRGSRTGG